MAQEFYSKLEKLILKGPQNLKDEELLAIL